MRRLESGAGVCKRLWNSPRKGLENQRRHMAGARGRLKHGTDLSHRFLQLPQIVAVSAYVRRDPLEVLEMKRGISTIREFTEIQTHRISII